MNTSADDLSIIRRDCGLAAFEAQTFSLPFYHGFIITIKIATNPHHRISTGHQDHIVAPTEINLFR